ADQRQNAAVNGTAAALAASGFNLSGTGVTIGQNESGLPNYNGRPGASARSAQMPAGNANLPAARFTWVAATNITNHASEVGGVIVSTLAAEPGIATSASIRSANNSDVTVMPDGMGGTVGHYGSANLLSLFNNANTRALNMSWGRNVGAGSTVLPTPNANPVNN